MSAVGRLKAFLFLISVGLAGWNYFFRESFNIPFLSEFSPGIVWAIVGTVLVVTAIINWTIRDRF